MFTFMRDALVWVVNAIIAGIGGILSGIASLFPALPSVPDPPGWLQAINFFFPVGAVITIFGTFLACYAAFLVIRVLLRWVRAL